MNTHRRNASRIAAVAFLLATAASAIVIRHASADDWLPVPPADLAMDNPAEPGADAMILYRNSHVDARRAVMDGSSVEEYARIKIFTEKGAEQNSNVQVDYWRGEYEIKDIGARTIKPDGTIVNFDGQVFDKAVESSGDSRYMAKAFTLPQVQPGCIIEYKFREQFARTLLPSQMWTVSGRFYMRDAMFSIAPYSPRSEFDPTLYFRTTNLPQGVMPQRQGDGSYKMEIHNLPGVVEEPLMPPPSTLEARVEFFYRRHGEPTNETTEQYWNNTGKSWSDAIDKFIDKRAALDQALSQTVSASDTPEQKLRKIYERVQKIPDLSYQRTKTAAERKAEDIKPNENVEDVLKRNYATGRQLNWLFIGLVRAAGFQADAAYIAMRNRSVFIPQGQNPGQLGADLVWVNASGKEYWLDPAAIYYPFGLLPFYETECKGVRVSKTGAEFIQTPAAASDDAKVVRSASLDIAGDGAALGRLDNDYTGVSGASRRTLLHEADETGRKKHFENEIKHSLPPDATVEITQISDWDDISKPIHVEASIELPTYGSVVGHRILVPASLFVSPFRESFESEKRVNPIRFPERFEDIDDVTIHVPKGFTMEALPPAKDWNAGNSFTYRLDCQQHGATLEIKRRFAVGDISFPRDQYSALRSYFMHIKSLDDSQLVLAGSANAAATAAAAPAASTSKN